MLAHESRARYDPAAAPLASASSLRAAVHSIASSSRKNGIANSTGSRICGGSTSRTAARTHRDTRYYR